MSKKISSNSPLDNIRKTQFKFLDETRKPVKTKSADLSLKRRLNLLKAKDFDGIEKELLASKALAPESLKAEKALQQLRLVKALHQAEVFLAGKQYTNAFEELVVLSNQFPRNRRIIKLMEEVEIGEALSVAEAALSTDNYEIAFKIAKNLSQKFGETNDGTKEIYRIAIYRKSFAKSYDIYTNDGREHMRLSKVNEVLLFYRKVMDFTHPGSKEYEHAEDEFNRIIEEEYTQKITNLKKQLAIGEKYLKSGNVDAALAAVNFVEREIKMENIKIDSSTDKILVNLKIKAAKQRVKK